MTPALSIYRGGAMNLVDVALIVTFIFTITNGWQLGIIRAIFGFAGLVVGGWFGLQATPVIIETFSLSTGWRFVGGAGFVIACALLGQSLGFAVGTGIRNALHWSPIRLIDSVFGAVFRGTSWAVIVWLLASVIAFLPDRGIVHQVRTSQIVGALDDYAPSVADQATAALRRVLRGTSFPEVFAALAPRPQNTVEPADRKVLNDPEIKATYASVFEVVADAHQCGATMTGTGFVFAPERIMTNAHVVAGADAVGVRSSASGQVRRAEVVYFDPALDVAVLKVPGLRGTTLTFGEEQPYGVQGVVPGFTGGKPMSPDAARISELIVARGHDIYGLDRVDREVYILRASIAPGDSGAPFVGEDGSVLGVVFAGAADGSDTGYALTANAVARAATLGKSASAPVSTATCLD